MLFPNFRLHHRERQNDYISKQKLWGSEDRHQIPFIMQLKIFRPLTHVTDYSTRTNLSLLKKEWQIQVKIRGGGGGEESHAKSPSNTLSCYYNTEKITIKCPFLNFPFPLGLPPLRFAYITQKPDDPKRIKCDCSYLDYRHHSYIILDQKTKQIKWIKEIYGMEWIKAYSKRRNVDELKHGRIAAERQR